MDSAAFRALPMESKWIILLALAKGLLVSRASSVGASAYEGQLTPLQKQLLCWRAEQEKRHLRHLVRVD